MIDSKSEDLLQLPTVSILYWYKQWLTTCGLCIKPLIFKISLLLGERNDKGEKKYSELIKIKAETTSTTQYIKY